MSMLDIALDAPSLDDALGFLQRALGIDEGDVAGQVFQERDHIAWRHLRVEGRRLVLLDYLKAEMAHAKE